MDLALVLGAGVSSAEAGGRIFFSGASRSLIEEDEIRLTSVGVDIGSSTSHLMISEIVLERMDTRYVVVERRPLFASEILLTPYLADGDIDTLALGTFIDVQYVASGFARSDIDTGALILTGVAVRRRNARAIGDLFAAEAGKFVAVSAGDSLEALMAAHGSGAVAASRRGGTILSIDVGGGTTKLAVCRGGTVVAATAVEAGARLLVAEADRVVRLERFGARAARQAGRPVALGDHLDAAARREVAQALAAQISAAIRGAAEAEWLRLPGLPAGLNYDAVVVSGGVSEYMAGHSEAEFGDLGPELARALGAELSSLGLSVLPHADGIRATVLGASQYTVQLSGSTVFIDPPSVLPLRNVATIRPAVRLDDSVPDPDEIAGALRAALDRLDLSDASQPVAVAFEWRGSASFARLDALARGIVAGMAPLLAAGLPLVLVTDGDVGGLLGMHLRENAMVAGPVMSIDGIMLAEFDFIDIGEGILATGAVPVVVKSLVFPEPEGDAGQ